MAKFRYYNIMIIICVIAVFLLFQSVYIVDETQRAIVLQLGKPISDVVKPGLHFKIPFLQNVMKFDYRILEYDAPAAEIITKDKKTLVVDNYARWRIKDPLVFYKTVRTISRGVSRLEDIVYSELRVALGGHDLIEIVSFKRDEIMEKVTKNVRKELLPYGIEVIDVRIKRTDLPQENLNAIFARMRSERQKQAKQYRSEGYEIAAKIRAEAEKERTIILAEARKKAEIIMGEGEAEATKIYVKAFKQNPEFYSFWRTLKAYELGLEKNTTFILTPKNKFLNLFK